MKKIIYLLATAACIAIVSCQKEIADSTNPEHYDGEQLTMLLTASQKDATKTTLDGTTAKWTSEDKVSVLYKKIGESTWSTGLSEQASSGDSYETATFTTSLTNPDTGKDAYAIYPGNALDQDIEDKAKITIASVQHPTGTDFDGSSDILISKSFTPAATVSTQFARVGAILKISVNNASLAGEKLISLSIEGANALAGDVLVGLSDHAAKGIENGSNTVTAEYEPANQFEVGSGSDYVYLIVMPQTLANGSHLIINGETTNYTFTRDISLDQEIHLNAGHIVPMRIAITSIVLKEKVFFEERFAESTGTMGWSGNGIANGTINTDIDGWVLSNGSGAGGAAKFGTGSKLGEATTPSISINPSIYQSQAIKLSFKAGAWAGGSENTVLSLTATNCKLKYSDAEVSSVDMVKGEWTEYTLNVTDITGAIKIKFAGQSSSNSRFLLDDVCVYFGSKPVEKPTPDLSFSTTSVSAYLGETASFTEPALTNNSGVDIIYESSDTDIAEVASDGQVTLKAAGSTTIRAIFAGNELFSAQTVSYDLTVKNPTLSVSPPGDILIGGAANSVKTITVTATHAWTASLDDAATTARGRKFNVLDGSDVVINGAITGTAGITTIKFKVLGNGDPNEVSSYGTITITDDLYAGASSGAINIKQSAGSAESLLSENFSELTTWSTSQATSFVLSSGTWTASGKVYGQVGCVKFGNGTASTGNSISLPALSELTSTKNIIVKFKAVSSVSAYTLSVTATNAGAVTGTATVYKHGAAINSGASTASELANAFADAPQQEISIASATSSTVISIQTSASSKQWYIDDIIVEVL